MPIYALLLVMFFPSNQDYFFNEDCMFLLRPEAKKALLYMFTIFCVLLPGVSFIILQKFEVIDSVQMESRKERTIPIIVMLMYCLALFFLFQITTKNVIVPKFVYSLPLSGVFVTATYFFLNRWKKVSIHAGGAGIMTGFILAYILLHVEYSLWMLAISIIVSGVIISARLYLQKHSMIEMVTGWLTASFLTFAVNYFY
jgi:hypothetical protein